MSDQPKAYRGRNSIRLPGFDYAAVGWYFITLVCHSRRCLFGAIHDGAATLSTAGLIAEAKWLVTPDVRPDSDLL